MVPDNDDAAHAPETSEYKLVEEKIETNLDPDLQEVVISHKPEMLFDPSFNEMKNDDGGTTAVANSVPLVDVVAKLRQPDEQVESLNIAQRMGQIVTGTVRADEIERVRAHPNVLSLKAARRLRKELGRSVREIRASREQLREALPQDLGEIDGSGVVVGIVDRGCDFAHPNFLSGGNTRVKFLWDQHSGPPVPPPHGFHYGREFNNAMLDAALAVGTREEAYERLSYNPGEASHGTFVMDIAAGHGSALNPPGVAPRADIIFVDLSAGDFKDHQSLGNSRQLLEAFKYVFDKAGARPVVINASLNVNGGPHDGSSLVEQGIDELLRERNGRAVVIAAGNSRSSKQHIGRLLKVGGSTRLLWQIPEGDDTGNKLEMWYSGAEALEVFLFSPRGEKLGPFPLGKTITLKRQGSSAGRVFHRYRDPNNGDNQLVLRFGRTIEAGIWGIALRPLGPHPVLVHAWIESDPGIESTFKNALPSDTACTIGSLACGGLSIAVSAYDPDAPDRIPTLTAEGPTRNKRNKPEISAPGVAIKAAWSCTDFTIEESGTSAAAPHIAGLIALLMQAAGQLLPSEQIRELVINHVRHDPPPAGLWDTTYGGGRADAVAAILACLNDAPQPLFIAAPALAAAGESMASHVANETVDSADDGAKDFSAQRRASVGTRPAALLTTSTFIKERSHEPEQ